MRGPGPLPASEGTQRMARMLGPPQAFFAPPPYTCSPSGPKQDTGQGRVLPSGCGMRPGTASPSQASSQLLRPSESVARPLWGGRATQTEPHPEKSAAGPPAGRGGALAGRPPPLPGEGSPGQAPESRQAPTGLMGASKGQRSQGFGKLPSRAGTNEPLGHTPSAPGQGQSKGQGPSGPENVAPGPAAQGHLGTGCKAGSQVPFQTHQLGNSGWPRPLGLKEPPGESAPRPARGPLRR